MSSFFNCVAYDDLTSTIRLGDHVIFLALEDKENNTSVHLTLNPFQVRILAKYLTTALSKINFVDLLSEEDFGDLSVKIEVDDMPKLDSAENFYDNELMYVKEENSVVVPF